VCVFTASQPAYADAVLNFLDPDGSLIHHRLYREHCLEVHGLRIKDLRIIENWDPARILIIDNAPYSFGYQISNGVPIITWHNDRSDRELKNLIPYMKRLVSMKDFRVENERHFGLKTFYEDFSHVYM
jgi:CTD small phosphatase-like protein 2